MPLADTECEADALALELREPLELALEQADALIADEALPQGVGEILALGLRVTEEQPLAETVGDAVLEAVVLGDNERDMRPLTVPDVDSDGEPDVESVPEPHCE